MKNRNPDKTYLVAKTGAMKWNFTFKGGELKFETGTPQQPGPVNPSRRRQHRSSPAQRSSLPRQSPYPVGTDTLTGSLLAAEAPGPVGSPEP